MRTRFLTVAAVAALAVPAVAWADEEITPLTIGDTAPAIEISHWLKGNVVESFEDDKVYVVEFWATWCGPCVASMPHISELQEKYRDYDVTFIGVSDEPLSTVVEFLFKENKKDGKTHHERTNYTLTTDPDRSVYNSYMKAAAQRGIPTAFIVGKNQKVEWIGHPMTIDEPLDAVVKDSWNRDEFKVTFEKSQAAERAMMAKQEALQKARAEGDWKTVLAIMDEVIGTSGNGIGYKAQKFMVMAKEMGDYEKAYAYADEVVTEAWDSSGLLNQIAWFIVDEPGLDERDLELAMKAAHRANELTEGKDGAILDTVARVYYEQGNLEKALKYQRKAVKHAEGPMQEELEEVLKKYEKEAGKN